MTTRMLINATVAHELRIAIVEDGELIELDIETTDQNQLKGNIYKGVVHNVEGSLAAAFVDIGGHKQGFLPFDEISPKLYARKPNDESPRINDVIKRGQEIIVQVAKDAIGEKGVTLTTYLSLPGRFTVLMPGSDANGVSRKIEDETARKKVRAMAAKIARPDDCGFIVRTAGLGQKREQVQKDLDNCIAIYEKVMKSASMARAPSLLYAEPDLISRTLRDFFNEEIDEVWIDSNEEYQAARGYFEELMPQYVDRIQWYQNPIPIFAYYHVEEQIEATFHRTVALPSGGSIVIDETEALVAVDVNSGKMTSEKDHEDTVYKTNLEAATEIARQLKLRDLGGIIVVDFIDMEQRKNERAVEKALAEVAKEDKARYKISKINAQGLCVLTRQRIRQGLRRAFQRRCQVCSGTGWIRTPESHSLSLLRRVETRLAQGGVGEARVATHRETAEYILNYKRSELMALERAHHCRIVVAAKPDMDRNSDEVSFLSKGEILAEITDRLPPREERRGDRASKRKRAKKKKLREQQMEAAPEARVQNAGNGNGNGNGNGSHAHANSNAKAGGAANGDDRAERKKRKRKRDRAAAQLAKISAQTAPEAEVSEIAPDAVGTATFTGRPPADLERIKAERRARMAGRPQRVAAPTQQSMEQISSIPMPASDAPRGEAHEASMSRSAQLDLEIPPRADVVESRREEAEVSAPRPPDEVRSDAQEPVEPARKPSLFERLGLSRSDSSSPPPDGEV